MKIAIYTILLLTIILNLNRSAYAREPSYLSLENDLQLCFEYNEYNNRLLPGRLSLDKKKFVYFEKTKKDDDSSNTYIIENGKKTLIPYDSISNLTFSPNSSEYAYLAKKDKVSYIIQNGQETKVKDGYFSSDLAYHANGKVFEYLNYQSDFGSGNQKTFITRNGKDIGVEYDRVNKTIFSSDGKHMVNYVTKDDKNYLLVDGKEVSSDYNRIHNIHFIVGTNKLIYTGRDGEEYSSKTYVIKDGVKISTGYESITNFSASDDGETYTFLGKRKYQHYIVKNNSETLIRDPDVISNIALSSDGKDYAYAEIHFDYDTYKKSERITINGKTTSPNQTQIRDLSFSLDNGGLEYYAKNMFGKEIIVKNGKEYFNTDEIYRYNLRKSIGEDYYEPYGGSDWEYQQIQKTFMVSNGKKIGVSSFSNSKSSNLVADNVFYISTEEGTGIYAKECPKVFNTRSTGKLDTHNLFQVYMSKVDAVKVRNTSRSNLLKTKQKQLIPKIDSIITRSNDEILIKIIERIEKMYSQSNTSEKYKNLLNYFEAKVILKLLTQDN